MLCKNCEVYYEESNGAGGNHPTEAIEYLNRMYSNCCRTLLMSKCLITASTAAQGRPPATDVQGFSF